MGHVKAYASGDYARTGPSVEVSHPATALPLEWRPFRADDETERNYVLSSWLRSYAESSEFRHLARGVFFAIYEPIVKAILARSTVAIAFTPELPNTVVGFLVTEGDDVVHYVHTKRRFRRMGVARWMTREFSALPAVFTHHPSTIASRLCGPSWTLDPMRRFEKKAEAA